VVRTKGIDRSLWIIRIFLPEAAFAKFAEQPEPRLRGLACRDLQLSAFVVARLSRDEDVFVRISAAGHPNLPTQDLMRLFRDQNLDVVQGKC
jgi:hypothetical protein